MATNYNSAEQMWLAMITGVVATAITVVETLNRAQLMADANDLQALITTALPGHAVGESEMIKEQAEAYNLLLTTFAGYLDTPMSEGGMKPVQVLYKRWPAPITE